MSLLLDLGVGVVVGAGVVLLHWVKTAALSGKATESRLRIDLWGL
jgi:hypothetical protein